MLLAIGAHPLVQGVWLVLRLTQTYEVHSGYDFSESLVGKLGLTANESSFHDHHHTYNVGNFGAEHTDWLFGATTIGTRPRSVQADAPAAGGTGMTIVALAGMSARRGVGQWAPSRTEGCREP